MPVASDPAAIDRCSIRSRTSPIRAFAPPPCLRRRSARRGRSCPAHHPRPSPRSSPRPARQVGTIRTSTPAVPRAPRERLAVGHPDSPPVRRPDRRALDDFAPAPPTERSEWGARSPRDAGARQGPALPLRRRARRAQRGVDGRRRRALLALRLDRLRRLVLSRSSSTAVTECVPGTRPPTCYSDVRRPRGSSARVTRSDGTAR